VTRSRSDEDEIMRYVVAIAASAFMFAATWFLSGLVLLFVFPERWSQMNLSIGGLHGNLAGILGALIGAAAAVHTFRTSLTARTGRLFRRSRTNCKPDRLPRER